MVAHLSRESGCVGGTRPPAPTKEHREPLRRPQRSSRPRSTAASSWSASTTSCTSTAVAVRAAGAVGAHPLVDASPPGASPGADGRRHHAGAPAPPVARPAPVPGAMIGTVPPRTLTELVGRHEEVHRVVDALGLDDGGGGAVPLGGDAGIGKTALVTRLVSRATDRRVLVGHCVGEVGTSLPYLPFVEMVAGLDARERDLVDDLVVGPTPGSVPLVPGSPAAPRGCRARRPRRGGPRAPGRPRPPRPVLVVVEDVHWADESTRER